MREVETGQADTLDSTSAEINNIIIVTESQVVCNKSGFMSFSTKYPQQKSYC